MFKKILRKDQSKLKNWLYGTLSNYGYSLHKGDGYLYKDGTFPVMLVCHLDTVHKKTPTHIIERDGVLSAKEGIGADDRCGVYMAMEIIKKYDCAVLFCEDEEIGCVGATKFTKSKLCKKLKGRFNYLIELDRKGGNDAVFYRLDNPDFEDFITKEYWKADWGSYTDICELAPALDCAAVNLSCGYYKAHTKDEYVVVAQMERNIKEVCKLLARTDEEEKFAWHELTWDYGFGKANYYDDSFYIEYFDDFGKLSYDMCDGTTEVEAIGWFLINHPELTYSHITMIENCWEDYGKCAQG